MHHAPRMDKWTVVSHSATQVTLFTECLCGDENCGWSLSAGLAHAVNHRADHTYHDYEPTPVKGKVVGYLDTVGSLAAEGRGPAATTKPTER